MDPCLLTVPLLHRTRRAVGPLVVAPADERATLGRVRTRLESVQRRVSRHRVPHGLPTHFAGSCRGGPARVTGTGVASPNDIRLRISPRFELMRGVFDRAQRDLQFPGPPWCREPRDARVTTRASLETWAAATG